MITPENPPGFLVRTEAQKAAADNDERGTTAPGSLWIASASSQGPWLLSIHHSGVVAEMGTLLPSPIPGLGLATFMFATLAQLHAALDRVYKLAVSLPDAPLARFRAETATLLRTTEAERLVIQRIGQDMFRDALMDYWGGRCLLTLSPIPRCCALHTSCPGPTAQTRSASTCTTAYCCRHSGLRPSIASSSASLPLPASDFAPPEAEVPGRSRKLLSLMNRL
jgi:hypothetical protein